jgi:hypothetical protein
MELQGFEMSKKPGLQNHRSKRSRIHSACACFLLISLMSVAAIAETSTSRSDEGFAFALIGDMPYDARQREEFLRMMAEINSTDLAFVVHVGDFWFDGAAWKPTSPTAIVQSRKPTIQWSDSRSCVGCFLTARTV